MEKPGLLSALKSGVVANEFLTKAFASAPPSLDALAETLADEAEGALNDFAAELPADAAVLYEQMVIAALPDAAALVSDDMDAQSITGAMLAVHTDPEHCRDPMPELFRRLTEPTLARLLSDKDFVNDLNPEFMQNVLTRLSENKKLLDNALSKIDTLTDRLQEKFDDKSICSSSSSIVEQVDEALQSNLRECRRAEEKAGRRIDALAKQFSTISRFMEPKPQKSTTTLAELRRQLSEEDFRHICDCALAACAARDYCNISPIVTVDFSEIYSYVNFGSSGRTIDLFSAYCLLEGSTDLFILPGTMFELEGYVKKLLEGFGDTKEKGIHGIDSLVDHRNSSFQRLLRIMRKLLPWPRDFPTLTCDENIYEMILAALRRSKHHREGSARVDAMNLAMVYTFNSQYETDATALHLSRSAKLVDAENRLPQFCFEERKMPQNLVVDPRTFCYRSISAPGAAFALLNEETLQEYRTFWLKVIDRQRQDAVVAEKTMRMVSESLGMLAYSVHPIHERIRQCKVIDLGDDPTITVTGFEGFEASSARLSQIVEELGVYLNRLSNALQPFEDLSKQK